VNFIAGALAKFISTITTYPYSTIKVNMQGKKSRKGIIMVILEIYMTYGLKGFYKGIGSKLIGTVLNMAIMMVLYERLQNHFRRQFKESRKVKLE
jgi:hypothetical protein